MNPIKIIFFDVDGTLIDMQRKRITEVTRDALKRLQARGIKICMATGRTPVTLPRIEGITFDAYLTFNGSYCFAGDQEIFSRPIARKDVEQLLKNAAALNRPVSIATRDRVAANGRDDDLVEYYSFAHLEVDVPEDFDQVLRGEVYQVMLGCRMEERPALMRGVENAKIAAWWDRAVDVIPASGGKGAGVAQILKYFGFDRSQAMAFGDGNNDIEMLQAVDHGIAMENGSDDLKAVASDVCGHVAEDGVYHYCVQHGLL